MSIDMKKVSSDFFNDDARNVAQKLLGKFLVRILDDTILIGKIVETEAYVGKIDKACHAFGYKKTPKVMPLYSASGFCYIYSIYGLYHCFNIITGEENDPQGVLIRAIEPVAGFDAMSQNRFEKPYSKLSKKQILNLTSGPGKLCIALNLDRSLNMHSIFSDDLFVSDNNIEEFNIISCKRIGINYAEEAIDFPWRYYIDESPFVSIRVPNK